MFLIFTNSVFSVEIFCRKIMVNSTFMVENMKHLFHGINVEVFFLSKNDNAYCVYDVIVIKTK